MKLSAVLALALSPFVLAVPAAAQADNYPNKTVRIVVPYAPGGGADVIARLIGEQLRADTKQAFVVENKPGAFGIVALEEVVRSKPDGYTLFVGNVSTNTITPLLYRSKMSFDYAKSIVPVARIADLPALLVVTAKDFPPKTFAEFIDYAKKNPGKVRYGSAGVGSFPHFDAAIFAKRAGLDMIHIPNKDGAAGMSRDLSTGDVQVGFVNAGTTGPAVRSGLMRPIAVVADKRLPEYPDVPTMAEAGFPNTGTLQWIAMFARADTPKPVLDKLAASINQALKVESVRDAFAKATYQINPTSSIEDARTWMDADTAAWKKIIDEAKVNVNE